MTQQQETEAERSDKFPFLYNKIPVSFGLVDFQTLILQYPNSTFCPYIAEKDENGWNISTSRVYMNQVLQNFIYVPVNITRGDAQSLARLLGMVKNDKRIAAVNITQPHKSNSIVREMFLDEKSKDTNIDTLIRNAKGDLKPYDLNAPAFVGWFNDEVGSFTNKTVILVGVGGVGEPIAKAVVKEAPNRLILVDPNDKTQLAERLDGQVTVEWYSSMHATETEELKTELILINAAGKEGATDNSVVARLLDKFQARENVFIDIRPQLIIEAVTMARDLGWRAFTGHGMNARNDYALLSGIAKYMGVKPLSFTAFKAVVAAAS